MPHPLPVFFMVALRWLVHKKGKGSHGPKKCQELSLTWECVDRVTRFTL